MEKVVEKMKTELASYLENWKNFRPIIITYKNILYKISYYSYTKFLIF